MFLHFYVRQDVYQKVNPFYYRHTDFVSQKFQRKCLGKIYVLCFSIVSISPSLAFHSCLDELLWLCHSLFLSYISAILTFFFFLVLRSIQNVCVFRKTKDQMYSSSQVNMKFLCFLRTFYDYESHSNSSVSSGGLLLRKYVLCCLFSRGSFIHFLFFSSGTSMLIWTKATFQLKQIRDAVVAVLNVRVKLYLRRHVQSMILSTNKQYTISYRYNIPWHSLNINGFAEWTKIYCDDSGK